MDVRFLMEIALVFLLHISAITAGVIIARRRQERRIFRAFGLAVIVLQGLYLLYSVIILLIAFGVIPVGAESGASTGMTEYIPTATASP